MTTEDAGAAEVQSCSSTWLSQMDWSAAYESPELSNYFRSGRRCGNDSGRGRLAGASSKGPLPNGTGRLLVPASASGKDDDVRRSHTHRCRDRHRRHRHDGVL